MVMSDNLTCHVRFFYDKYDNEDIGYPNPLEEGCPTFSSEGNANHPKTESKVKVVGNDYRKCHTHHTITLMPLLIITWHKYHGRIAKQMYLQGDIEWVVWQLKGCWFDPPGSTSLSVEVSPDKTRQYCKAL